MVGAGLVAVFFTAALMALTKANAIASASRNSTGAYTIALKQIDWIQSVRPFNPQKPMPSPAPSPSPASAFQIPVDYYRNLDGSLVRNGDGTPKARTKLDPNDQIPSTNPPGTYTEDGVAIYNDAPVQNLGNGILGFLFPTPTPSPPPAPSFSGTMTTVITEVNTNPHIYSATVTVTYNYRNHPYSISMKTLRSTDE